MRFNDFLLAATLCLLFCAKHERTKSDLAQKAEFETTEQNLIVQDKRFVSIEGIDSIAVFDKSIEEIEIDSIFIFPISFDAKYIGCFKANLKKKLYERLKFVAPKKYEQIMSITTDHEIVKGDLSYHFHGMQNINCSFPESSEVRIESTIISLYSDLRFLGRIMVIDEIIKKTDSRCKEKVMGAEKDRRAAAKKR
jgi:hypothetical protein